MIALDTNLLVRLVTRDDEKQFRQATETVERANEAGEPIVICDLVLCELLWVLDRAFSIGRKDRLDLVEDLLGRDSFVLENRESIEEALAESRVGKGDFADYLIAAKTRRLGSRCLVTFDAAHLGQSGFEVLR